MKKLFFILAALSLLLTACGGTPTEETPPPLTGEDVQETAVAMAWTMAAETIAAMPTETFTPVPPTLTPTFTPIPPTATLAITNTPLPSATPEKDPCDQPLTGWEGASSKFLVVNETKNNVVISIYLAAGSNARGYCGYLIVPQLAKNQSTTLAIPKQGTYYVYAWASGDTNFSLQGGPFGVNNPDKHTITIKDTFIKFDTP